MSLTFAISVRKALQMIVKEIEHLPQGYGFWHSLPSSGRKSQHCLLKRWAQILTRELFPVQLRQAALLACLTDDGVPDRRSRALYGWILKTLYHGQATRLHTDWLFLKQAVAAEPSLLLRPKQKKVIVRPVNMPRQGLYTWHEYPPRKIPVDSTL